MVTFIFEMGPDFFEKLGKEDSEVFNIVMNLLGGLRVEDLSMEEKELLKKHGIVVDSPTHPVPTAPTSSSLH